MREKESSLIKSDLVKFKWASLAQAIKVYPHKKYIYNKHPQISSVQRAASSICINQRKFKVSISLQENNGVGGNASQMRSRARKINFSSTSGQVTLN